MSTGTHMRSYRQTYCITLFPRQREFTYKSSILIKTSVYDLWVSLKRPDIRNKRIKHSTQLFRKNSLLLLLLREIVLEFFSALTCLRIYPGTFFGKSVYFGASVTHINKIIMEPIKTYCYDTSCNESRPVKATLFFYYLGYFPVVIYTWVKPTTWAYFHSALFPHPCLLSQRFV
jgi:hypothetical protein